MLILRTRVDALIALLEAAACEKYSLFTPATKKSLLPKVRHPSLKAHLNGHGWLQAVFSEL